jgi:uncharacterized protein YjeT (DUF2065 family)
MDLHAMDLSALTTALIWLSAGLLVVAGISKIGVPDAAMAALHSLKLPSGRIAARVVGIGEIAVGIAVVGIGGPIAAAAIGVGYLALLGVAALQRARQVDCGCFGVAAAPVSRLHLAINAVAAVGGAAGVIWSPLSIGGVVTDAGLAVGFAGLVLLAAGVGIVRTIATQAAEDLRLTPVLQPAGR